MGREINSTGTSRRHVCASNCRCIWRMGILDFGDDGAHRSSFRITSDLSAKFRVCERSWQIVADGDELWRGNRLRIRFALTKLAVSNRIEEIPKCSHGIDILRKLVFRTCFSRS